MADPNSAPRGRDRIYFIMRERVLQVETEVAAVLPHSGNGIQHEEVSRRLEAMRCDHFRGIYHLWHLSDSAVLNYLDAINQDDQPAAERIFNAEYESALTMQGRYFDTVDAYERAWARVTGASSNLEIEARAEKARRQREAYQMPHTGHFGVQTEEILRGYAVFYDDERQRLEPYGATRDSTEAELAELGDRELWGPPNQS